MRRFFLTTPARSWLKRRSKRFTTNLIAASAYMARMIRISYRVRLHSNHLVESLARSPLLIHESLIIVIDLFHLGPSLLPAKGLLHRIGHR